MNKVRKKIIWIVCLLAVLTMGVTSVQISKADKVAQREIVDNIRDDNESNQSDKDSSNANESSNDDSSNADDSKEDKDNTENQDNSEDNINDAESDKENAKDDESNNKDNSEKESQKDNESNTDINKEDDSKEDSYTDSNKKDDQNINSSKTSYEIFMGNGLHVIGQLYVEENKTFSFDGKWFALEDTQYVYAIEDSKEDNITLFKAYVLIDNKESYIYFNADEAKNITVLGYKEADNNTSKVSKYNEDNVYKTITPDLKVTPIYKYVNKDTSENGKRYGSETTVGEKVIVVKKLRKWSQAEV